MDNDHMCYIIFLCYLLPLQKVHRNPVKRVHLFTIRPPPKYALGNIQHSTEGTYSNLLCPFQCLGRPFLSNTP